MTDTFRPPHVRRLLGQLPEGEARVVRAFMDTFGAALVGETLSGEAASAETRPVSSASAAQMGMWA